MHQTMDVNLFYLAFVCYSLAMLIYIFTFWKKTGRMVNLGKIILWAGCIVQFIGLVIRTLAARSAQLLNISDLAKDIGLSLNTIKAWISVLEASFQIFILRPYFTNISKRLVKTPKVYFMDTGTLCYLTGLKDSEHAASGPMGGPLLETAVLSEIIKSLSHLGLPPQVYFWRTSIGSEVDIIVGKDQKLVPIEVKASSTPRQRMASSIKAFQKDLGTKALPGYVVHPGTIKLPLGKGVTALPLSEL